MTAHAAAETLTIPGPAPRKPTGPRGLPLVGCLPYLRKDPLGFLERTARDHGNGASFPVLSLKAFLFTRPEAVEQVLAAKARSFAKGRGLDAGRPLLGNGLLTSEGDFWRRQRRLAQPAFHRERIARYADAMSRAAEAASATWRDGERRDLHSEMSAVTLRIVAETLFSAEVEGDVAGVGAALSVALEEFPALLNPLRRFFLEALPTPRGLRLRRAVARLDSVIYRVIGERRTAGASAPQDDLLAMYLAAEDEDGGRMSDQQLRDEVMTLFLAGHETTAIALTWACYLLARNPEADARLGEELRSVLGDRPAGFGDLPRLPYTEAVVKETMRVYPPAWAIGRRALEDVEVDGVAVPRGSAVVVSAWLTHRDARNFDDPLAFRPERWLDRDPRQAQRYAYFPFGGGPRQCIGNGFAMTEAILVLAAVARRFRFVYEGAEEPRVWPSITLRPRGGLPLRLVAR